MIEYVGFSKSELTYYGRRSRQCKQFKHSFSALDATSWSRVAYPAKKHVLWLHVIYSTTANSRNTLFRTQLLVTPDYIDMLLWPWFLISVTNQNHFSVDSQYLNYNLFTANGTCLPRNTVNDFSCCLHSLHPTSQLAISESLPMKTPLWLSLTHMDHLNTSLMCCMDNW